MEERSTPGPAMRWSAPGWRNTVLEVRRRRLCRTVGREPSDEELEHALRPDDAG